MALIKRPVVFVRGLNTSGQDSVFTGRWSHQTPMHGPWISFFRQQGVASYPLLNLGAAPLPEMLDRALDQLEKLPFSGPFHLIGHSAGGLIVRGIASHLGANRVLSAITLASPHGGATIAEKFLDKVENDPKTRRIIRALGYDERPRIPLINNFSRDYIARFTEPFKLSREIAALSFQFSLPEKEMSWIVRSAHLFGFKPEGEEHDGYIEKDSQAFGRVVDHLALDHLSQIGYHLYLSPRLKREKEQIFRELTHKVYEELVISEQKISNL